MTDLKKIAIQNSPIDIIAIGCSTGGPEALKTLLPMLPIEMPVPIVLCQHMLPGFTEALAESLNEKTGLTVRVASEDDKPTPGTILIAPPGIHMTIQRIDNNNKIHLVDSPAENSCKPAVDVLFHSLLKPYGKKILAVMLTGMGYDGLKGCQAIHDAGGSIIAQDEASSVVWGMPGAVAKANLAYRVLPLKEIAGEIILRAMRGVY